MDGSSFQNHKEEKILQTSCQSKMQLSRKITSTKNAKMHFSQKQTIKEDAQKWVSFSILNIGI